MNSLEDTDVTLTAETLHVLNEFLHEKAEREREEQNRVLGISGNTSMFEEDWQLSQFWYSEETKHSVGKVVQKLSSPGSQIALLSCPSLYSTIKDIHADVKIFEFDRRFSTFGDDFIFYDFNDAFQEPNHIDEHASLYDLIIADPPFLSEDCIIKTAHIIKKLKKPEGKIIFCSGKVVEPWVTKFLDLKLCNFCPAHNRNLGNEFVSFANFNLDELL
ncbi:protein-lysine N-methyltransferase CG9154 [Episyrphus balteatus]|uniref:protein-lysine N-methyltransferase CG9154 n=1 Tax=Episyrphus balteatus TaxID=286459 RepID=UPI0024868A48|nr:protein-lysine N-methyltransferase CG9154 [Episyrphus balteatus]